MSIDILTTSRAALSKGIRKSKHSGLEVKTTAEEGFPIVKGNDLFRGQGALGFLEVDADPGGEARVIEDQGRVGNGDFKWGRISNGFQMDFKWGQPNVSCFFIAALLTFSFFS